MKRIGIVASRIAKGDLLFYNAVVMAITLACALILFLLAGIPTMLALLVIGYIANGASPHGLGQDWWGVMSLCMVALTVMVTGFALMSLVVNMKLRKN